MGRWRKPCPCHDSADSPCRGRRSRRWRWSCSRSWSVRQRAIRWQSGVGPSRRRRGPSGRPGAPSRPLPPSQRSIGSLPSAARSRGSKQRPLPTISRSSAGCGWRWPERSRRSRRSGASRLTAHRGQSIGHWRRSWPTVGRPRRLPAVWPRPWWGMRKASSSSFAATASRRGWPIRSRPTAPGTKRCARWSPPVVCGPTPRR